MCIEPQHCIDETIRVTRNRANWMAVLRIPVHPAVGGAKMQQIIFYHTHTQCIVDPHFSDP